MSFTPQQTPAEPPSLSNSHFLLLRSTERHRLPRQQQPLANIVLISLSFCLPSYPCFSRPAAVPVRLAEPPRSFTQKSLGMSSAQPRTVLFCQAQMCRLAPTASHARASSRASLALPRKSYKGRLASALRNVSSHVRKQSELLRGHP